MTNENMTEEQRNMKREADQRRAEGVPNNAEQKLTGARRGSGADTPSGPNTDRSGERARDEVHESVKHEGGNSLSTEPEPPV